MKPTAITLSLAALFCTTPLLAQQQTPNKPMQNMPMQNMPMHNMPMNMQHESEVEGVGVIKALDPKAGTITIKHQAIASIHWPAMTMTFKVAKPGLLQGLKVGEQVRFGLRTQGMSGTVTWVKPAGT
ncbi:MAG: copper-binding protein [Rhodanobacteraceae bacterium]|nr:MAG: copper-binding protein [Rhodanobacteraceae bacterium]